MSERVLILGVDGMDPSYSRHMVRQGKMPNLQKLIANGAARQDLMMIGGMPTITPPMWTTLSTGAYPVTHSITDYSRQSPTDLDMHLDNYDSSLCKAEPLWNVTVQAGKKTLVWHWLGCSWPPTLDDDNLHVVDGFGPGPVGMRTLQIEKEVVLVANELTESVVYKAKAASALGMVEGNTMTGVVAAGLGSQTMWLIFFMFIFVTCFEKNGGAKFVASWFISRKLLKGRPLLFSFVRTITPRAHPCCGAADNP